MTTFADRIVTREMWGAKAPPQSKPYFPHLPNKITIHHYGFPDNNPKCHMMPFFEGSKTLVDIQKKHRKEHGLIDLKYHYLIAPNGDVYECRPDNYIGRHVQRYDDGNIGVVVFGNFNIEHPTEEIQNSIIELIMHLKEKYSSIQIPHGIHNHAGFELTSCPGFHLMNYINHIKWSGNLRR